MIGRSGSSSEASPQPRRLAVIGAGPVGLEAALMASDLGFDVRVYEAGEVGAHLDRFAGVRLFTPFAMNSTDVTRERLRRSGISLPDDGDLLQAGELRTRYLEPIAALPELRGRIRTHARVTALARDRVTKPHAAAWNGSGRARTPFLIQGDGPDGPWIERAEVVLDASGVLDGPLDTGPGGLRARGEEVLGDRVDRHPIPTLDAARERYRGRRVLLAGCGHSAATALVDFEQLGREGSGPSRVEWIHRARGGSATFTMLPEDPLTARRSLAEAANRIAASAPWLSRHAGSTILAYERGTGGTIRVVLEDPDGGVHAVDVDRVLALVGYRPRTELFRELRVHLCYATEGPMALAAALDGARAADPARAGDCLTQTTHGPETLRTTEPGFFVLGAKAYGRAPDFLLRVGYEQVREVATLLRDAVH